MDGVALLLRNLPRLKSLKFLRKETSSSLFDVTSPAFTSALEELIVWEDIPSRDQLHTLFKSFPSLRHLRLYGSVDAHPSYWDMLSHLTSLTVRVHSSSLVDMILRSRLGHQLTDFCLMVKIPNPIHHHIDVQTPVLINLSEAST